ncbi:GNAT family N-acetyltransferase [Alkaliphilus hydrothermalis]|uniref:Ribosomal protein S18 acetylase RimI-like enzyme n=1 Tax=Alkaliphilus hydrothermalis TaxID=1482730 RepID=A0ABS2NLL8_9FIRM|nr:GNAT family N-acetyltransferase [Alkaliphilus hydrothermalis]MBM7613810.1 ribosomal protein S18 acetylase RimI-like enzyme [Alkaliphilus hydrothermalis]
MIKIIRNDQLDTQELNNLLSTIGWGMSSNEKLEQSLNLSWGWITAREEPSGELVGFVQILSDGIKHAYILRMLVAPDYQGQGIGTKIIDELMILLRENKINPILITKPTEESFYQKFGFVRETDRFISMLKWD